MIKQGINNAVFAQLNGTIIAKLVIKLPDCMEQSKLANLNIREI